MLDPQLIQLYRTLARIAGISAGAVGALALLGWIADVPLLTSLGAGWVPTKVNTAILLIVAGIGLVSVVPRQDGQSRRRTLASTCGAFVTAGGLAALVELMFDVDLGIDQLLIQDVAAAPGTVPGRMAPTTAVSFLLIGAALTLHARTPSDAAAWFALLTLVGTTLVLSGYLLGAAELYTIAGRITAMAVPTALSFFALAVGLILLGVERGWLRQLASAGPGAIILRRLLPVVVLLPLLTVWLRLRGEDAGWFGSVEFGAAAAAVADMLLFAGGLYWFASKVDGLDAARLHGEISRVAAAYTRSLIEASSDPLVTISDAGTIMDVNRAMENATGRSRAELIGADFANCFTEPERARDGYRAVLARGSVVDYPLAIRHASGKVIEVSYNASVYPDEVGAVAGVVAAARDVTETLRVQAALRESEAKYRLLADNISDLVAASSDEGPLTYVSRSAKPMLGYEPQELLGLDALSLVHPDDAAEMAARRERSLRGEHVDHRLRLRRKDGSYLWVESSTTPIKDATGSVVSLLSIIRDGTRHRAEIAEGERINVELEERVQLRTAELDAANKELEGFSYSVSHDLKVPLRAIDGFARILVEDYGDKLDAEGRRVAGVIRDGAQKMGHLIDDILAFSRAGRVEMVMAPVDMNELVRAALQDLAPALVGRKLTMDVKPLPPAFGDVAMLRRVWTNLLDNAIKFTKPKDPATIEVGTRTDGDETVYYVQDSGVGFDMAYADKLFGVFQRLHGPEEFSGTGIGLAIARRVVSRHGGRIWAEGKVQEGALFSFTLPMKDSADA